MASPTAPRLITLALILVAGAALAVHGASAPATPGVALNSSGSGGGSSASSQTTGSTQGTAQTGSSSGGSSGSSASSSSNASSKSAPSTSASRGPLLSSTQIAPFTYEIYPQVNSQAALAESGFTVKIGNGSSGEKTIDVQTSVPGGGGLHNQFRATDKVYWVETSFGDDGPGQDANFGDDMYIMTDAQGYITQK